MGKLPDWELIRDAIAKFGTTINPKEAGYILPKGKMLDFSGKADAGNDYIRRGDSYFLRKPGTPDYLRGQRFTDHREVQDLPTINGSGTDAMYDFMTRARAGRFQPSDMGIGFETTVMPDEEQLLRALEAQRRLQSRDPALRGLPRFEITDPKNMETMHSIEYDKDYSGPLMDWFKARVGDKAEGGPVFDPEGEGYDYEGAGDMERDDEGHMGSVAEVGPDKYLMLKGRKHPTWQKAVDAERERGFGIIGEGDRYYSVPLDVIRGLPQEFAGGGPVKMADGGDVFDTYGTNAGPYWYDFGFGVPNAAPVVYSGLPQVAGYSGDPNVAGYTGAPAPYAGTVLDSTSGGGPGSSGSSTGTGTGSGAAGSGDTGVGQGGSMSFGAGNAMGAIGSIAGSLAGVPGLGVVGTAVGTAADAMAANSAFSSAGFDGPVGIGGVLSAIANAMSFGAVGESIGQQAADAMAAFGTDAMGSKAAQAVAEAMAAAAQANNNPAFSYGNAAAADNAAADAASAAAAANGMSAAAAAGQAGSDMSSPGSVGSPGGFSGGSSGNSSNGSSNGDAAAAAAAAAADAAAAAADASAGPGPGAGDTGDSGSAAGPGGGDAGEKEGGPIYAEEHHTLKGLPKFGDGGTVRRLLQGITNIRPRHVDTERMPMSDAEIDHLLGISREMGKKLFERHGPEAMGHFDNSAAIIDDALLSLKPSWQFDNEPRVRGQVLLGQVPDLMGNETVPLAGSSFHAVPGMRKPLQELTFLGSHIKGGGRDLIHDMRSKIRPDADIGLLSLGTPHTRDFYKGIGFEEYDPRLHGSIDLGGSFEPSFVLPAKKPLKYDEGGPVEDETPMTPGPRSREGYAKWREGRFATHGLPAFDRQDYIDEANRYIKDKRAWGMSQEGLMSGLRELQANPQKSAAAEALDAIKGLDWGSADTYKGLGNLAANLIAPYSIEAAEKHGHFSPEHWAGAGVDVLANTIALPLQVLLAASPAESAKFNLRDALRDLPVIAQPEGIVSPRKPFSLRPSPERGYLENDMSRVLIDPEYSSKISGILKHYPILKPSERTPEGFRDYLTENFDYLLENAHPATKKHSPRWYHGMNRLGTEIGREYEVPLNAAQANIATQSPQTFWDLNAEQAALVAKLDKDMAKERFSPAMEKFLGDNDLVPSDVLQGLRGMKYEDLKNMGDADRAANFLRAFEQTNRMPEERIIPKLTPHGVQYDINRNLDQRPRQFSWGAFDRISNALKSMWSDGRMGELEDYLGAKPKVRSFHANGTLPDAYYQYGIDPVTVDAHMGAGGLFLPVGPKHPAVNHAVGDGPSVTPRYGFWGPGITKAETGLYGLSPIYADAIRAAGAKEGRIPASYKQPVLWTTVNDLFNNQKNEELYNTALKLHNDRVKGRLTHRQMLDAIVNEAGGIKEPDWARAYKP